MDNDDVVEQLALPMECVEMREIFLIAVLAADILLRIALFAAVPIGKPFPILAICE
jgi:hypothetical protein